MGLPSGRASICWAWREDRWEKQMANRQWGGSVPPGGRRRLGMALSCCQSNGDYVEHAHTRICHLKNELAFGPPVGFRAGQWGGKKKKNASLEGLPVPRGPPPAASQMKIKRPTPWLALSKDGVAGVRADGRTANQQEVPGVVYKKFSKELHFLKSLNFLLSPMLPACRLMRNTIVFYPKP